MGYNAGRAGSISHREAAASGATESGAATEPQTGAAETAEQPAGGSGTGQAVEERQPADGDAQQATGTEQPAGQDSGDAAAQDETQQPSNETTSAVNDTVEQRTEIREIVREVNVEPARDIDFEVSIGVAAPQTIGLRPLPPRIVELVPVYEGYRFFVLADGRIVIVEPASYEIVLIIA